MLIVGYVFAIRSERQLCSELQVNMAYRWFFGLSIESTIPDHSVFSRARHERFRQGDILRRVFEHVVGACIVEGLVGGEAFSVDASLIQAYTPPHAAEHIRTRTREGIRIKIEHTEGQGSHMAHQSPLL